MNTHRIPATQRWVLSIVMPHSRNILIMGSGSGGVMCFARLVLGADTAIDSSRGCKNSTLVGDDMVAVVSAAALMRVVP